MALVGEAMGFIAHPLNQMSASGTAQQNNRQRSRSSGKEQFSSCALASAAISTSASQIEARKTSRPTANCPLPPSMSGRSGRIARRRPIQNAP